MKKFSLSLAAILAMSAFAVAGGDIEPVVEPVVEVAAPVADAWSGPYVGMQIGYVFGDADSSAYDVGESPDYSIGADPSGFVSGVFAGYNWLLGNDFLLGVEGEYNLANADDSVTMAEGDYGAIVKQEWDASVRLRAGKVMGDYMPYITGGVAWAGVNTYGWTDWDYSDYNDADLQGWTIGAGVEQKISDSLHARIQYRYSDYGDDTWDLEPENDYEKGILEYSAHIFTVGVSYRF